MNGNVTPTASMVDRRPEHVAGLGFLLQGAAFGVILGIGLWAKSDAVLTVARLILAGIPVWGMLYLAFKQARRVRSEELETAELLRSRQTGLDSGIFEVDQEALLLERGRLQWLVKWLLPGTTVLVTAYLLAGNWVLWHWNLANAFDKGAIRHTEQPTLVMWFVVAVGFLCFLYARYALALARLPEWRVLHAGASFMAGNALVCLALVIALMAGTSIEWAEPLLAYVIRVVLIVLGIEFAVNLILDFYRPRSPGEIPRPSFDSRLLGLISEPGGVAKSIADAVNYQFGFEVSSTWFYQLLQRWMLPLTLMTALLVVLLSGVVMVDADEAAVVERLGRLMRTPTTVLEPGLHLKWPYPFDVLYRAPVRRMNEMVIGEAAEADDEDPKKAIVWTEAHDYVPELLLPVASQQLVKLSPQEQGEGGASLKSTDSAPVSLIMVSVPMTYRIKNIEAYLHTHLEPLKVMEAVAYQYLSEYAAGVDVDQLIGPGREQFNIELKKLIQARLDQLNVGVEVAFVGIRGAHPPNQEGVAQAFQDVISAQIKSAATVYAAIGEAQRILTAVAGTESRAKLLDEAIAERDQIAQAASDKAGKRREEGLAEKVQENDPAFAAAQRRVDQLFQGDSTQGLAPMSGRAAAVIARAQADTREWVGTESVKAQSFKTEVAAFNASPTLYAHRKLLEVYEGMDWVRKYLIIGDPSNVIFEYETSEQGGLDRVLNQAVEERKKRSQE